MKASGGWKGHDRSVALPEDWPQRKAAVWARDGDVCWMCRRPGADTIDHLGERHDHRLEMLAPVHDRRYPHCHRYRSSAQGHEAQRRIRERGRMPTEQHPGLLS